MAGSTSQPLLGEAERQWKPRLSMEGARLALLLVAAMLAACLATLGTVRLQGPRVLRMARLRSQEEVRSHFLSVPCNSSIASHLFNLTQEPHLAGTPENMRTADYVLSKFQEYGLEDAHFADYPVLLSYPISTSLSMEAPVRRNLKHREGGIPGDPYSANGGVSDLFLAYSPSGSVTAEVVYANYGRTADFATLQDLGVDCTGKIILMRYGEIFRGDKVANAAKAAGAAAIIYSDPEDSAPEGTNASHVYPHRQWLPSSGGQRGTIYEGLGDPETPGWPSTFDGERLSREAVKDVLPTIPAMPISYADAEPILTRLGGQVAPQSWWGGIRREGHGLGPGPVVLNMTVEMDTVVRTIRNVIASVEGSEEPERYVVLGNHRDAWVFGAADPNSGTSCMLTLAEGLGRLLRTGWRPRRSIILCSWDAEEYGLIGSTEWVEANEDLLHSRAVAYVNVDVSVSGPGFSASSTPQLDRVLWEVAKEVADPDREGLSVYDTWLEYSQQSLPGSSNPQLGRLGGGGSDFAPFLQHIGVPAVDMEYGDQLAHQYAVYHSVYDNYNWMSTFGDPGFHRHVACTQVWGLLVLRLADDALLPFDYGHYAQELAGYAASLQDSVVRVLQETNAPANAVSVSPLFVAVGRFVEVSGQLRTQLQALQKQLLLFGSSGPQPVQQALLSVNERMLLAERAMLDPEGLGGTRSWYRHLVYAPALDDNYGSVAFPAIVEALAGLGHAGHGAARLQHEIFRAARAVDRSAAVLRGALV